MEGRRARQREGGGGEVIASPLFIGSGVQELLNKMGEDWVRGGLWGPCLLPCGRSGR